MSELECKNLSFSYENGVGNEILKNISFRAEEGEAVGIIGANGVGKSTLLRVLTGLELNFSGEVMINHMPVTKKTLPQIRSKLGYLFQDSENQLFTHNVYDDIAFSLRNRGMDEKQVDLMVKEALDDIGISHLIHKKTYKLSGGEKKMVSIATILAMKPEILLMDEPTIALDPRNRRMLIQILNDLNHMKIIASHDLDMVMDTCHRVILFSNGEIVADGPADKILRDKLLLESNGLELPLCMNSYAN